MSAKHGQVLVEEVLAAHVFALWLDRLVIAGYMVMNASMLATFLEDHTVTSLLHV